MSSTIYNGDCLQVLPSLPVNTFDALVTDPPASISFMDQEWDSDKGGRRVWVSWLADVMRECLRVLKPGAHGLVWAIPRRSHWTAWALEDAGFQIRDCIHHYFCSGFPKNMSVDKKIDVKLRVKRKVVGARCIQNIKGHNGYNPGGGRELFNHEYTEATSPQARQWKGWGTHLKPAIEHWWLVRKPLSEPTVAENVLKWSTGAMNIDASRIPLHHWKMDRQAYFKDWLELKETDFFRTMQMKTPPKGNPKVAAGGWETSYKSQPHKKLVGWKDSGDRPSDLHPDSRFPSHFIVSDWELMDKHSGFFHPPIYCPKARRCRGEGNHHPTVKPVELMKYFITLLTRPGGSVLDCFAGSFSTGIAAQQLACPFTGIEIDATYVQIGVRRLSA
jgi:site-specific DNA-methyltransferase (adenine-specific)